MRHARRPAKVTEGETDSHNHSHNASARQALQDAVSTSHKKPTRQGHHPLFFTGGELEAQRGARVRALTQSKHTHLMLQPRGTELASPETCLFLSHLLVFAVLSSPPERTHPFEVGV